MKRLLFAAMLVALCAAFVPATLADACSGMDGCTSTAETVCGRPADNTLPCPIQISVQFGPGGAQENCAFRCSCTGWMEYTIWCEGEGGGGERECNPMDCPSMSLNEAFPMPDEQPEVDEVPSTDEPVVSAT